MNKKILFALLLGALAFTNAEETIIEDLGEEDTTTQVSGKKTRPKLSPEERAQRIAQKKQLNRVYQNGIVIKILKNYLKKQLIMKILNH